MSDTEPVNTSEEMEKKATPTNNEPVETQEEEKKEPTPKAATPTNNEPVEPAAEKEDAKKDDSPAKESAAVPVQSEEAAAYNGPDYGDAIRFKVESIFGRANEGIPIYESLEKLEGISRDFKTDLVKGVDSSTVEDRRAQFGVNELPKEEPITFLQILIAAWSDHMIIILTIAAIVSLILGLTVPHPGTDDVDYDKGWIEGFAIIVSVLLVTTVSSVNDYNKELKFRKLSEINEAQDIAVIRDGEKKEVDIKELVVGDLVTLNAGLVVPVDCFYVRGQQVVIDESSVTGENDPKKKTAEAPFILTGTVVNTSESGWALVGAVGINSFGGKLLMESRTEGGPRPTPLQDRLDEMAEQIGYFGMAAAGVLFIVLSIIECTKIGGENFAGQHFLDYFITAVAIVVVAVPEGLPLAVTIALAFSQNKMREDNNQVRRLKACETMGNATQICSDKTGTLTQNLMSVVQGNIGNTNFKVPKPGEFMENIVIADVDPKVLDLVVKCLALNSSSEKSIVKINRDGTECDPKWVWDLDKGNKTDNALLDFVDRVNLEESDISDMKSLPHQRMRAEIKEEDFVIFPFTSSRKRMSVCVKNESGKWVQFVKGGSDQIVPLCDEVVDKDGNTTKFTDEMIDEVEKKITSFAREANRTIGLAFKELTITEAPAEEPEEPLVWLGVIGIQDPLRPEVKSAVTRCINAGVTVRMCTGDNLDTAIAISRQCGIYRESRGDVAMTGTQFRNMVYDAFSEEGGLDAFAPVLERMTVLARSQPLDKQLLVLMHMMRGEIVAVTGDGTNDAPALRLANVGFVMKSGTDIAVKSADIVLLDDNFRSVQRAVVWGRTVNDNIRKFLQLQLSVNVVSVLLVFIGSVSASDNASPLSTVQLLWINLIMDTFAAMALATEEPNEECLERGPVNRKAPLLTRRMIWTIGCQSVFQLAITLAALHAGHDVFKVGPEFIRTKKFSNETTDKITNITTTNNYREEIYQTQYNTEHKTVVFNLFVWMVIFNEFNARKLYRELNIFEGFQRSKYFIVILVITCVFQVVAVEYFDSFMKTKALSWKQWLGCIGIGFCAWPVGIMSRFFPIEEPEYDKEFDEEDLDEDAADMWKKLQIDIQETIASRTDEEKERAGSSLKEARKLRSRQLWKKVAYHHVHSPKIVKAFKRAFIDQDMKSTASVETYTSFHASHKDH